jgi:hypothetical protein
MSQADGAATTNGLVVCYDIVSDDRPATGVIYASAAVECRIISNNVTFDQWGGPVPRAYAAASVIGITSADNVVSDNWVGIVAIDPTSCHRVHVADNIIQDHRARIETLDPACGSRVKGVRFESKSGQRRPIILAVSESDDDMRRRTRDDGSRNERRVSGSQEMGSQDDIMTVIVHRSQICPGCNKNGITI